MYLADVRNYQLQLCKYWKDDEAAWNHHCHKMHKFFTEINVIIKKCRPEATVYYNWTTPFGNKKVTQERYWQYNTKQDLEDLPTTWAGYDVFPVRAKYYANTLTPLVAMSGKFHSAWGEFGGFKHPQSHSLRSCQYDGIRSLL